MLKSYREILSKNEEYHASIKEGTDITTIIFGDFNIPTQ